jgi:hypothetical protein
MTNDNCRKIKARKEWVCRSCGRVIGRRELYWRGVGSLKWKIKCLGCRALWDYEVSEVSRSGEKTFYEDAVEAVVKSGNNFWKRRFKKIESD